MRLGRYWHRAEQAAIARLLIKAGPGAAGSTALKYKKRPIKTGFVYFKSMNSYVDTVGRKISIQGEGALPLVQLSINFKLCCWKKSN